MFKSYKITVTIIHTFLKVIRMRRINTSCVRSSSVPPMLLLMPHFFNEYATDSVLILFIIIKQWVLCMSSSLVYNRPVVCLCSCMVERYHLIFSLTDVILYEVLIINTVIHCYLRKELALLV